MREDESTTISFRDEVGGTRRSADCVSNVLRFTTSGDSAPDFAVGVIYDLVHAMWQFEGCSEWLVVLCLGTVFLLLARLIYGRTQIQIHFQTSAVLSSDYSTSGIFDHGYRSQLLL